MTSPFDRKLTAQEEHQIQHMINTYPEIDYLIAETIVLMPKDELSELVNKHKKGELKSEPEPKREYLLKTGKVEPEVKLEKTDTADSTDP